MWNPFIYLIWGAPLPTDGLLTTLAAIIPVFFIALVIGALPALSPDRIVKGRFSLLSFLPATVGMIYVELQALGFLGAAESQRPPALGSLLLWEIGLIMVGTIWTIVAADFSRRKSDRGSAPAKVPAAGQAGNDE